MTEQANALAAFDRIESMAVAIAEASDVIEVLRIQDDAAAFARWVRARENGEQLARRARVIVLTAERRIGEMSAAIPRVDPKLSPAERKGKSKKSVLERAGISQTRATAAERLAKVPQKKFDAYVAEAEKPSVGGALIATGAVEHKPATTAMVNLWRRIAYDAVVALEKALNGYPDRAEAAELRRRCRAASEAR